MAETQRVKLSTNDTGQAVSLPEGFRFDSDEIYIWRDEKSRNVILSTKPGAKAWEEFFAFRETVDVPKDWMVDRPLNQISLE